MRTPVVDVMGQLIRDVIGRLSLEPRCNWLGRLNSTSVCCLTVDVVDESFVGCGMS